ncbi:MULTISPECIES: OmpA family protein [Sulfurospirillum]|jgi:peptidoglycan-associated lipoprotein|uniref:OmpA family protein n=1 Tax=Sulfurospirillum TaxID=57665 RepID=UPI0005443A60|nr:MULTISPECIES: OmpA family protein [Sulfurospirillum]MCD8545308.1 OmpA family protein [Sulfurospirillum cavolei]KHG35089.1 MAG: lipoprotein [Sulfurospirillum sp. MES]MCP3651960.1 OmpA family protein [Sulfurospirillum sp. DNRA8]MCR1810807.1 OmpA family protein [Sulfurospirillum sp. DNRA8]MDY0264841.1 OmpA family protein [Sulfurospirillum cavolei]
MGKLALTSLAVAVLVLTGCSQKSPEVDMTKSSGDTKGAAVNDGMSALQKLIASLEANSKKIYFDFDKYNIRKDQQANIDANAALFNSAEAKSFSIKVEGNCDEFGTDEYNYALGLKRAKSVKDGLVAKGMVADRITVVSYGESNPACSEHNKDCWAQNRRAEFKVLP